MSVPQVRMLLATWLIVANVISFALFAYDKHCARRHKRRIPESELLKVTALGGSLGALLAMLTFRHKTRHLKFTIGVPVFLIVQIALIVLLTMGL